MPHIAYVFPGQGAQAVGMGRELAAAFPVARAVFEEVDAALSQNLSRLMFEGPAEELVLTENAQPALMAAGIAALRVLEEEAGLDIAGSGRCVAGHSLGEYTALCAAGTLSLADTARALKARGQAMQQAVPVGEGAMAAILGLELDAVQAIAAAVAETGVCAAANDNAPGQVVLSGHAAAVERAVALASDRGARRAVMLVVSAPFHCPLMQPAAERMADVLADIAFAPPSVPVVCNVTAETETDPSTLRDRLIEQVTGMVRWRESVIRMTGLGVVEQVELGAGKVLTGLARRIDRSLSARSIETPADIAAFLSARAAQ